MLATIQKISSLTPIKDADRIETAQVLGWDVVVKKGEFSVGDLCIYVEIDSLIPRKEWSEFLFSHPAEEGKEDFHRLRTVKLRKQISQGLVLPLNVLKEESHSLEYYEYKDSDIGDDVTELLEIKKYEKQIPPALRGTVKGNFPNFLRKTDEERIQSDPELLEKLKGKEYYITVKMDGTSATYYKYNNVFGVCSRNLELKNPKEPTFHEKRIPFFRVKYLLKRVGFLKSRKQNNEVPINTAMNIYWQMAEKYKIADWLPDGFAIQGEICGPGIQENKIGLEECKLFVFNVFDIVKQKYIDPQEINMFTDQVRFVPRIDGRTYYFDYSQDELLDVANNLLYPNDTPAEGIVVRSVDQTISFKVVSNNFLLKYKE